MIRQSDRSRRDAISSRGNSSRSTNSRGRHSRQIVVGAAVASKAE